MWRRARNLLGRADLRNGLLVGAGTAVVALLIGAGMIAGVSALGGGGPTAEPRTELPTSTPLQAVVAVQAGGDPTRAPATVAPTPTPSPHIQAVHERLLPSKPQPIPTPSAPPPSASPVPTLSATGDTLLAVVIVGPSSESTTNIARAEEFAARAEAHGMEVRRVYHPHATWENVLATIQGANLVVYFGHGNGWPSIYGSFQESTKDGFGLDTFEGASDTDVTYYGADMMKKKIKLAPNAVVVLSHLCYSAGNAEPGLELPDWEVALNRVDNYANGFLAIGARAVFAYGTGSAASIVDGLFSQNKTMDAIFMTHGAQRRPFYGFTGWEDRYFDSLRTPGSRNHLDPGEVEGFLRAVTGDLDMTTFDWRGGAR